MKNLFVVSVFLVASCLFAANTQAQLIIITNPAAKATEISNTDLRDVFTGSASSLKDVGRVAPVLLKGGTVHEEFLHAYIGKSDATYRAFWRSLVFSGQVAMPKSVDTEGTLVDYVAHNPGTIGYISKQTPHESVKVLAVK